MQKKTTKRNTCGFVMNAHAEDIIQTLDEYQKEFNKMLDICSNLEKSGTTVGDVKALAVIQTKTNTLLGVQVGLLLDIRKLLSKKR